MGHRSILDALWSPLSLPPLQPNLCTPCTSKNQNRVYTI
jgi:hypothetical protein